MYQPPSRLALLMRHLRDPIVLRRWSPSALLVLALAVAAGGLIDGAVGRALTVIGWLLLIPVGVAFGYGEAFFVAHGRGVRRAILALLCSAIASLPLCVILSTGGGDDLGAGTRVIQVIVTLVLFLVIGLLIASASALGFGLGTGYLARKIDERSHDEWP